jgi:hypothetical protein
MRGQSEHAMVYVIVVLVLLVALLSANILYRLFTGGSMNAGCKMLMRPIQETISPFTGGAFVPFSVLCDIIVPNI